MIITFAKLKQVPSDNVVNNWDTKNFPERISKLKLDIVYLISMWFYMVLLFTTFKLLFSLKNKDITSKSLILQSQQLFRRNMIAFLYTNTAAKVRLVFFFWVVVLTCNL